MLRWFRRHASRIAVVAMGSLAALGVSVLSTHADDCHDSACLAMAVEHDADGHHVVAPRTDTDAHPLHCLVCHWARSFRPQIEARILTAPVAETGTALHFEIFTAAAVSPAAQPPLRSPPQFPAHA